MSFLRTVLSGNKRKYGTGSNSSSYQYGVNNMNMTNNNSISLFGSRSTHITRLNVDTATVAKTNGLRCFKNQANQCIYMGKQPLTLLPKDKRPYHQRVVAPMYRWNYVNQPASIIATSAYQAVAVYTIADYGELQNIIDGVVQATTINGSKSGNRGFMPYPVTTPNTADANQQIINPGTPNNTNKPDSIEAFEKIKVPLYQKEFTFRNPTSFPVQALLYEYICKRGCGETPDQLWSETYNTANDANNGSNETTFQGQVAAGSTAVTDVNYTMIGQRPHGYVLKKFWKQVAYAKVLLQPGQSIKYTMTCYRHKMNQALLTDSSGTYLEGWSKALMVVLQGVECSSANAGQENVISTTDAELNVRMVISGAAYVGVNAHPYYSIFTANTAAAPMYPVVTTADQRITNDQTEGAVTYADDQ